MSFRSCAWVQRRGRDADCSPCRVYQSQTCEPGAFTRRMRRRNASYAVGLAVGSNRRSAHVDVRPRLVEQGEVDRAAGRAAAAPARAAAGPARGRRRRASRSCRAASQATSGAETRLERARLRVERARRRRAARAPRRSSPTASRSRWTARSRSCPGAERRRGLPVGCGRRRRHAARAGRRGRPCSARSPPEGLVASRLVLFQQFLDDDLGCASYLVGDEEAGVAAIVDPPYAIEPVLEAAARRGVEIVARRSRRTRTPTTSPATAGSRSSTACPISIHPAAEAEYAHDALDGRRRARARRGRPARDPHARPPARAHLPRGRSTARRADEPWLVLTGDSLFVGDAARPDLAVGAKEGAEGLFHSLRRLLELPDGVEVFPGHVAGSLCGKAMSSKALVDDRVRAPLQPRARRSRTSSSSSPSRPSIAAPKPPNMARLVELNRGPARRRRPGGRASCRLAAGRRDRARRASGRATSSPATRHGALNVPVSGTLVRDQGRLRARPGDRDRRPGRERRRGAARGPRAPLDRLPRARRATSSAAAPSGSSRSASTSSTGCSRQGAELIDVRERDERDGGYIAGSRNIPYRLLARRRRRRADRPAGRDDLRERRARRDRGVDPRRAGHRRPPGARRRHQRLGRPRRPDGRVPPLRLVSEPRRSSRSARTTSAEPRGRGQLSARGIAARAARGVAVLLVAHRERQLDLGLADRERPCPRGGARPRRRSRAPRRRAASSLISSPGRSASRVRTTRKRPACVSPCRITWISERRVDVAAREDARTPRPRRRTLPASSAATGAAPAPSTRSFVRSSRSTIAWLICSSVTVTTSSSRSRRIAAVSAPGLLDGDPLGDRVAVLGAAGERGRCLGLDADEADVRPELAQRDRDPGREAAAADRDRRACRASGSCSASSSPTVPWPAITRSSSKAWTKVAPRRLDVLLRGRERLVEALADELDAGAVVPRRVDLRHRRVLRHEDRGRDPGLARRPRDRLAVVAGARRDDAGRALLRRQRARSC